MRSSWLLVVMSLVMGCGAGAKSPPATAVDVDQTVDDSVTATDAAAQEGDGLSPDGALPGDALGDALGDASDDVPDATVDTPGGQDTQAGTDAAAADTCQAATCATVTGCGTFSDGCGGFIVCGCDSGTCKNGTCTPIDCPSLPAAGCCDGDVLFHCAPPNGQTDCAALGLKCGWDGAKYGCVPQADADPTGAAPYWCPFSGGCAAVGFVGECAAGADSICVNDAVAKCVPIGGKLCAQPPVTCGGATPFCKGGVCVACQKNTDCSGGNTCVGGACVADCPGGICPGFDCATAGYAGDCPGNAASGLACLGKDVVTCSTVSGKSCATLSQKCTGSTPLCSNGACVQCLSASDCPTGIACNGGKCTNQCQPSCTGKVCGSDGCNGTCGPGCGPGWGCAVEGQCHTTHALSAVVHVRVKALSPVAGLQFKLSFPASSYAQSGEPFVTDTLKGGFLAAHVQAGQDKIAAITGTAQAGTAGVDAAFNVASNADVATTDFSVTEVRVIGVSAMAIPADVTWTVTFKLDPAWLVVCQQAADCDDGNVCSTDACDANHSCSHAPAPGTCDDGNLCTLGEACKGLACGGGKFNTCDDNNPCTTDSCSMATGGCVHVNTTSPCDDGSVCTTGDQCSGGKCVSGAMQNCDDSNSCTTDQCDAVKGCVNTKLSSGSCDTSDVCAAHSCQAGVCTVIPGSVVVCADGNQCTTDSCTSTGGCAFSYNTGACNDGDACTVGDACNSGMCVGGAALKCDDSNVCTTDICDHSTGCLNVAKQCDDGNTCTTDSCDASGNCQNVATTGPCDDSNACTFNDTCTYQVCTGGSVVNCDDSNACTSDSCNPTTGCLHQPITPCP